MKKFLYILILCIFIVVASAQTTKAFSLSESLTNLANKLSELKVLLKAQVIAPPPYYSPFNGGSSPDVLLSYSGMKSCVNAADCQIVETACCACDKGGSDNTKIAINKNYFSYMTLMMTDYCKNSFTDTCSSTNNCRITPIVRCENYLCTTNLVTTTTTTTSKPSAPQITNVMRSCTSVANCQLVESACCGCSMGGNDNTRIGINKTYASSFANSLYAYCSLTNQKYCTAQYKCQTTPTLKCENNLCTPGSASSSPTPTTTSSTTTTTTTTTTTSTTTTTTKPIYDWFKANITLGDPKEIWYGSVLSCVPKNATKDHWKSCFNSYMSMNNIPIKTVIVGEVNTSYCAALGCTAPAITIEVDKQYKTRLESLGFVTTDDPTIPVDTSIINIDLSTKGLFYAIDRVTKFINYEVINKNDKTTCGDGICQAREKYLYELDLSGHCSMLDNSSINYKHCPIDCKDKLDANSAITKDDFNLVKIKCINKIETKPVETPKDNVIPVAPKAINLMTQTEKNEFIVKLQIMLIDLLRQLLVLMKK